MNLKIREIFCKYKNQLVIVFSSYIALTIIGFCMSWTVPVEIILKDEEQTPLPEVINDITVSWIGSVIYLGTGTGPFVGSIISAKYGRIPSLISGCGICILAFTLQSFFTYHISVIFILRILQGFGISAITINSFAYVGEVSSAEIRGLLLGLVPVFQSLGSLILIYSATALSYKGIGYLGMSISLISLLISWFLPESPLWLALNGKQKASELSLKRLKREDIITIYDKQETKSSLAEIFHSRSNRKALFIVVPILILQTSSGSSAITFFTTSIYEKANLNISSDTATLITTAIGLLITTISSGVVDKIGRRILLLISTFGTSVSLATFGLYFYLDNVNYSSIDNLRWLPVVCVISFTLFFSFGFGPIPYTLMAELFTKSARTLGPALTMFPAMIMGFASTTAYGYMITSIGTHNTFWIHSVINIIAFVFTLAFVPETKGKTLNEIEILMSL